VIERLLLEPHRFQFVQAMRILARWLEQCGVARDDVFARVLRFQNSFSLSFPSSEIEALVAGGEAHSLPDLVRNLAHGEVPQIAITPALIGILGTSGPLPVHHTEQIAAAEPRAAHSSARAFIDIFSQRMVQHSYRAAGKYRFDQDDAGRERDRLKSIMLSLCGARAGGEFDDLLAYHAARLRTRPVSAATIGTVLTDYFATPVHVEEFNGAWDSIPPNRRSTLGVTMPTLAVNAVLGTRIWRHDLRVRLNIGPLDKAGLFRFLPRENAARALEQLLATFAVPNLQYEVRLLLAPPAIEPLVLQTSDRAAMKRLGWNAFLTTRNGRALRPEVRYMLHPTMH